MEQKLEIKQALNVFSKVTQYGQKIDHEYHLNGIWASTDFDGYTVMLRDQAVTLHIFFHNSHKFTYKRKIDLEQFMTTLKAVDKMQIDK